MTPNHHIEPAHECDAIRDLIPEYAFGLTSPEDTRLVESNISLCPEAVEQLADFRHLQELMREDVTQVEPPAHLSERLMAAVAAPAPASAPVAQPRKLPLAWLAAAAAIIVLVITNLYWMSRVDELSLRQEQLAAQLGGREVNDAFILTSTADLRWVRLPPDQEGADSNAFLMWNGESEIGLLYVRGFPELSSGKTYQLWLTRGEERVSAGTFEVDDEGDGALLFHSAEPIDDYTWARITEEPGSGSDQPSDTVVVHGEL
jgi:hypothetical protein